MGNVARSALSAGAKDVVRKAIRRAIKSAGTGGAGMKAALENPFVRQFLGDAANRALGKAASAFSPGNIDSVRMHGMPRGLKAKNLEKLFGLKDSSQFMTAALYKFLSQYLPHILRGDTGSWAPGAAFGQKLLPVGGDAVPVGEPYGGISGPWANYNHGPPTAWITSDGMMSPDYPLPPSTRVYGGLPERTLGWGGWNADDLLDELYDDPMGYWERQVGSGGTKAIGADPFAEQNAEMDWRRAQRRKDAMFNWETQKKLDEDKQIWIDNKMAQYYSKPMEQWKKEKLPEAAGTLAGTIGEGLNIYNSVLANALMQSAASMVTPRQAELYGNPFEGPTAMYAGGRKAFGGVAESVGKNFGEFLRDWSDDIRAEFERQRIMRLQMDQPQTGRVVETLGDVRASDTRFRGNWNGRRSK